MAGRPPSYNPKRRNPGIGVTRLPAEGRTGDAPKWPASMPKPSAAEKRTWADLWSTPQAVAWERLGWTGVVARYCRVLVEANMPGYGPVVKDARTEARQLEDRLGLTPKAMRMLLWVVATDEVDERRQEKPEPSSDSGARRLRAVDKTGS